MTGYDFVQIGNAAIRLDKVTCIQFSSEGESTVWIHLVGGKGPGHPTHTLTGATADAFRDWWDAQAFRDREDAQASVWVIEVGDE